MPVANFCGIQSGSTTSCARKGSRCPITGQQRVSTTPAAAIPSALIAARALADERHAAGGERENLGPCGAAPWRLACYRDGVLCALVIEPRHQLFSSRDAALVCRSDPLSRHRRDQSAADFLPHGSP